MTGESGGDPNHRPTQEVRPSVWEQEPFGTIRANPARFGWGVPLVFVVSIGAGLMLADRSLSLAIAVQLGLQTAGLLWLYIPAFRRRERQGGKSGVSGDSPPRD